MVRDRSWGLDGWGRGTGRELGLQSPETRAERTITALFARHNAAGGAATDPAASVEWVCRTAERLLGIDGACITLVVSGAYRGVRGVTDPVLRLIDAAQFGLGVGPSLDAAARGVPVLLPDFATDAGDRWPVFTAHVSDYVCAHDSAHDSAHDFAHDSTHDSTHVSAHDFAHDSAGSASPRVGAFYAFPLICADERLGALAMYRREPGRLSSDVLAAAATLARLAALVLMCTPVTDPDLVDPDLVRHAGRGAGLDPGPGSEAEARWVEQVLRDQTAVDLAVGIVIAGLGLGPAPALARLRAYAFGAGKDLVEIAHELTSHRLDPRELDA